MVLRPKILKICYGGVCIFFLLTYESLAIRLTLLKLRYIKISTKLIKSSRWDFMALVLRGDIL